MAHSGRPGRVQVCRNLSFLQATLATALFSAGLSVVRDVMPELEKQKDVLSVRYASRISPAASGIRWPAVEAVADERVQIVVRR